MNVWMPAYVGIGSNQGDPATEVRAALAALRALPRTSAVLASRLYRTRPYGPVEQAEFVNAAAGMLTQLSPQTLLGELRAIEAARGRRREQRWGPRILDLDLLGYGTQRLDTSELTVPHRGVPERGFVLKPLADIAPSLEVPGMGRVEQLLRALPADGIAGVLDA